MKLLPDPIEFEWDEGNKDKNLKKHNVTNKEAEEIFQTKSTFIFEDVKHSLKEARYMVWGVTNSKRKLTVFITLRSQKIRIISVRDMNKKERRDYEEKIQENTTI